jgi:hypothetical protein
MTFQMFHSTDGGNARSPFRIIEQSTGHEVDWINRFLDRECVRRLAKNTLRSYALDLLHFLRWWASLNQTDAIAGAAVSATVLLDYLRFQAGQLGNIGSRSGKTEYRLGWTLQSHMRTRRARCPCISQRANPLRSLCAESASRNRLLPKFHITPSGRNRGPKQHSKRGFRKVTSGSHGAAQAPQDTAGWDVPTGR